MPVSQCRPQASNILRSTTNTINTPHRISARFVSVVSVSPHEPATGLALSVVQSNPTAGSALDVRITLPTASSARLALLDISGRQLLVRDVGSLGAGQHVVALTPGQRLKSGLYWIRLVRDSGQRTQKVVVAE